MRYVAGEQLNFLEKARSITVSPSADANFGTANLYDGYADAVFKFGSNGANPYISVDLAIKDKDGADNGSLDTWSGGTPTAWTVTTSGTGTVTETTVGAEVKSGSAAKLKKGSGSAQIAKTYRVRAGQRMTVDLWLRAAASGFAKAQLRNLVTGYYLTSAGAWQSAQAYFATESGTTYVQKTRTFTVQNFATCLDPMTYLELMVEDQGSGGGSDFAFVDDAFIYPDWNAVVIAGHNIEPRMLTELRSSTDGFGASNTVEATVTVVQPACFAYLSVASQRRYARLALTGTQSSQGGAPYYGELVITYLETSAVGPSHISGSNYTMRFLPDNIINTAPGGKVHAARASTQRRRVHQLSFRTNTTDVAEVRDEIHGRCYGALWPLVLVPMNAETVVALARIDDSWEVKRVLDTLWDSDLVVSDCPFPRVTS